MQEVRLTMSVSSEAAARLWAEAAGQNGALARHLAGLRLELTFPTSHAREHFESILDLTLQTLARRPGRA